MSFPCDIYIKQGSTVSFVIALRRCSARPCTDPKCPKSHYVDLTDVTARAMIRYSLSDPNPAGVFHCRVDEEKSWITFRLDAHQTAALRQRRRALWDCELVFPGGDVQRLCQGEILIDPEVTRGGGDHHHHEREDHYHE